MFQHIRIYVDIQILESNFSSLNYNSWSKCYRYEESLKLVYQTLLPFFSLFSKMWICNIYINNLTFFLEYFFHCKFIYNFVCYIQIGHYWPIPFFFLTLVCLVQYTPFVVFIPLRIVLFQHYAANSFCSGILFCSFFHIDTCACISIIVISTCGIVICIQY